MCENNIWEPAMKPSSLFAIALSLACATTALAAPDEKLKTAAEAASRR
jgi:hypothetical protein